MYLVRLELRKQSVLRGIARLHGAGMRNYLFTHKNSEKYLTFDRKSVPSVCTEDPDRRDLTPEEYNSIAADLLLSPSMQRAGLVPVLIKQEPPQVIGLPLKDKKGKDAK